MDEKTAKKEKIGSLKTIEQLRFEDRQTMHPPAEAFLEALPAACSNESVACRCGRLFVTINYNRDDCEEMQHWAEQQANKGRDVVIVDSDVEFVEIGERFVLRCPCHGLYRYQAWIDQNIQWILRYALSSPRTVDQHEIDEIQRRCAEFTDANARLVKYNIAARAMLAQRESLSKEMQQCLNLQGVLANAFEDHTQAVEDVGKLPSLTHLEVMRKEAEEMTNKVKEQISKYAFLINARQTLNGRVKDAIKLKLTLDQMGDLPTRAIDFDDSDKEVKA